MHVEKVKLSAASGGLLEHDFRYLGDGYESHDHVRDPALTADNFVVWASGNDPFSVAMDASRGPRCKSSVRHAMSDVQTKHRETAGRKPKSNAVGLVSTVITLPYDWPEGQSPEVFFKAAYQALEEYYELNGCDAPPLPAAVHMDETTPHMHHLKAPTKSGRLDANSLLRKPFYEKLHPYVQQRVIALTGVTCHVLLDEDDAERRALSHVPQDELDAAVRGLTRQAQREATRMLSEATRAVSRASKREKALEAREKALDAREEALRRREATLGLRAEAAAVERAPHGNSGKTMAVDRWA